MKDGPKIHLFGQSIHSLRGELILGEHIWVELPACGIQQHHLFDCVFVGVSLWAIGVDQWHRKCRLVCWFPVWKRVPSRPRYFQLMPFASAWPAILPCTVYRNPSTRRCDSPCWEEESHGTDEPHEEPPSTTKVTP